MGKIAKKAKEYWLDPCTVKFEDYIQEIEFQIDALRQEIQDLKTDCIRAIELHETAERIKTPEPELQCGDFISYLHAGENKKMWGVFHHQEGNRVWAYWQNVFGIFYSDISFVPKDQVTFEFRPEP